MEHIINNIFHDLLSCMSFNYERRKWMYDENDAERLHLTKKHDNLLARLLLP